MDFLPDLLNIREVAAILSVPESIVRRMIESRLMPLYRIAGVIRFDRKDVLAYAQSYKTQEGRVNTFIAPHKSHKRV